MAKCDTCGNDYDKAFHVTMGDRTMTFDSFECAIQAMAPECSGCGCRIIGHGLEASGQWRKKELRASKTGSDDKVSRAEVTFPHPLSQ